MYAYYSFIYLLISITCFYINFTQSIHSFIINIPFILNTHLLLIYLFKKCITIILVHILGIVI